MRVIHTTSVFDGGLRQSVLNMAGAEAHHYSSEVWASCPYPLSIEAGVRSFAPTLKSINLSLPMLKAAGSVIGVDIVHHHGCWSFSSLASLKLKKKTHGALVYSPHGAFIPASLKRGATLKKLYLAGWEKHVLSQVDCFHAISDHEAKAIDELGLRKPIALIPNGIDLQALPVFPEEKELFSSWGIPSNCFKLLFLSRLVPDKGLDLLLRALPTIVRERPELHLLVVGEGTRSAEDHLRRLVTSLGLEQFVTFLGGIYSDDKYRIMRNADLFVLPGRNEAQGLVVLESLAQQTPVIASRATPYSCLEETRCGWWVDTTPADLRRAIVEAMSLPLNGLKVMGEAGRLLVQQQYALETMQQHLYELYRWVKYGCRPPAPSVIWPIGHRRCDVQID